MRPNPTPGGSPRRWASGCAAGTPAGPGPRNPCRNCQNPAAIVGNWPLVFPPSELARLIMDAPTSENPLLSLGYEIPFDRIRGEHVEPAARALLAEARQKLEALVAEEGP